MFLIISYDLTDTTDVKVQACMHNLKDAEEVYESIRTKKDSNNDDMLLELINVPDNYSSVDGHTLFWGRKDASIQTIRTNNK